ncbi:MAG: hypothetical protein A2219_04155 [Elusimicrobia bacterium RIFOXYA2_FULL_50_26]|nr:MAG: hypothetical protein A2219_04155 [Elusimicrobia bacterium RIFOXYA2_FULL_50_26]
MINKAGIIITLIMAQCLPAFNACFAGEDGGRPGAFLSFGASARSLGMGKTFTGVADDSSAVYWNPAGLTQLTRQELGAMYAALYEQTNYSFASYGRPLEQYGSIGIAVASLSSSDFKLRDEFNYEKGVAGVYETAVIVSYAKRLLSMNESGRSISAGVSLKAVNQNINSVSATGYGTDVGAFINAGAPGGVLSPLSAGISLQNVIAPVLKLQEKAEKYPFTVRAGLGYRLFNDSFLMAMDVSKSEGGNEKYHFGAEYTCRTALTIRAGLDETEFTSGAGFAWRDYRLDYAFAYHNAWHGHDNLGTSHRFGISLQF